MTRGISSSIDEIVEEFRQLISIGVGYGSGEDRVESVSVYLVVRSVINNVILFGNFIYNSMSIYFIANEPDIEDAYYFGGLILYRYFGYVDQFRIEDTR